MERVVVPDFVVEQIMETVGSRRPESGGALLGLRDSKIITGFIFDPHALTGNAVFHNSGELIAAIHEAESATPQQFMGILHSHPRGVSVPSGQDRSEIAVALRENPSMPIFFSPILTFDATAPLEPHELAVKNARISVYGSHRASNGVELRPTHPVVAPFAASIRAVTDRFTKLTLTASEDTHVFVTHIDAHGQRFRLTLPLEYPTAPPIIVDEAGHQVPVLWRTDLPASQRLAYALSQFTQATQKPPPVVAPPYMPNPAASPKPDTSTTAWDNLHARLSAPDRWDQTYPRHSYAPASGQSP